MENKDKFLSDHVQYHSMTCRGICERLRINKQRYGAGIKRCTTCDVYIMYSENFCLCCGKRLRSKRKSKARRLYVQAAAA